MVLIQSGKRGRANHAISRHRHNAIHRPAAGTLPSPASCHPPGGALIIHLVANVASYGPYDVGQAIVPYPGTRMTFSPTLSFLVPVPQTATVDGLELRIWDTCESDSRWSVSSADLVVVSLN